MPNQPGRKLILCTLLCCWSTCPIIADDSRTISGLEFVATDWPFWRGPNQDGVASSGQRPPTEWSESLNVRWRTAIPGRGHGSAIVVGDHVYIAAADHKRKQQLLLALDRDSGDLVWESKVHEGGFKTKGKKMNLKATLASSTPASDGRYVFINFLNGDAVWTSAVGLEGRVHWQTRLTDYEVHQGYGSSPLIYQHLVVASADTKAGGAIVAMDRKSGEVVWSRQRPKEPNYPSPVVVRAAGRDQLIMTGCGLVTSLNPLSGEELWEVKGATTECVTTTVTNGRIVMTSGGFPDNHMSAIAADGSGKIVWENTNRAYVPSLLMVDDHVFAVLDAGIALCLDARSGEERWKKRLGGTFSSSLILVGDQIYATSEEGRTHIFKASPDGYQEIARNILGNEVLSSPAICGNQIFTRVSHETDGQRQEYVYCIGD